MNPIQSVCVIMKVLLCLLLTFWGLAKVAIFTTNVDAENQILINHKCVCGALNRHFCQTRVSTRFSHPRCCFNLSMSELNGCPFCLQICSAIFTFLLVSSNERSMSPDELNNCSKVLSFSTTLVSKSPML